MKILDELISVLDFDAPVRDIRQGVFHTAVCTRNCGLAATLPRDALRQNPPLVKEPGFLLEKNVLELARMAYSETTLEAAIGMAAINSVLDIDMESCIELNAGDLIAERGKDRRVAIVGHFPFVNRLHEMSKELWVIERNPREGDFEEGDAKTLIPQAEVVGITGTAITNHTLNRLLELCDPKAFVVVLGDTTPLSPVLFEFGVDALSGTKVMDVETVLRCVSQGANFRQIKGTRRLTMMRPG